MPAEEEVLKIGKKLEKMISSKTTDHSSAADLLKALQDIPMNLEALQKTRIGMTVNNFRKATTSEEVINLSKSLIKSWKKLLPDSNSKSESKKESRSNGRTEEKMDDKNGEQENEEGSQAEPEKTEKRRTSMSAPETSDPIRLKCRELLTNALKAGDETTSSMNDPEELAGNIEQNIFEEFNNTDSKYKNRVRSRVANLKDVKNPSLKENVLRGLIPADRIARMTAEEMASDSMKDLRAQYTKEAIDDHQMAKTSGTNTDLFKCGKCGKNNCTYNQVQTRSADEPMTTFVLCNECGNRWKFC